MTYRRRWLVGTIAVTLGVGLVGVALWIGRGDSPAVRSLLRLYADPDVLHAELRRWGVLAPLVFIGIQALQVVLAPIPGDVLVTPAQAQGMPSPAPLPPGTPPADGGSGALIMVGVFVAVLVIFGAIVKVHDVRRRREEQGLTLQAWLGDTLLTDPLLRGAEVIPTVRVPMRKGSPVKVEVMGSVPSPDMRKRVIHVVRQAATRFAQYGRDVEVEDRLSVLPSIAARRAA